MVQDSSNTGAGAPPPEAAEKKPICGVIMPISPTANHTSDHWQKVQTLIHMAILKADMDPRNAWEHSATDRISETIISNIFSYPIAVVDISDLNANVMIEFGLRLSSKMPLVGVVDDQTRIPFDAGDFRFLVYPSGLDWHAMEHFMRDLSVALQAKYTASLADGYNPFLSNIVLNVVTPSTREITGAEQIVMRIDDIARQLRAMERREIDKVGSYVPMSGEWGFSYRFMMVPNEKIDEALKVARDLKVDAVRGKTIHGATQVSLRIETRDPSAIPRQDTVVTALEVLGGVQISDRSGSFPMWA